MWKTISSFVAAALFSTAALAQQEAIVTPYGERMVAQMNTVLNYESTWGLSVRRDLVTVTGTATVDLENGFLSLETGATSGSEAQLESVDYGKYHPGRRSVIGVGVIPTTMPTGDGYIRVGGFTDENGVYGELIDDNSDGNTDLCIVYLSQTQSPVRQRKCVTSSRGLPGGNPVPADFEIGVDAFILNIFFNWYGVGGADFEALYVGDDGRLKRWFVGYIAPPSGQAMEDPNFPISAVANNGTASENIEIKVGGRRFDIEGEIGGFEREVGEFREDDFTIATGSTAAAICARRKSEFPAGTGRRNTVPVRASGFSVGADQDLKAYIIIDPAVTGGTWATAREHNSDESGVEFNYGSMTLGGSEFATSGPFPVNAAGNNQNKLSGDVGAGVNIQLPGNEPVCLMLRNDSGSTATISLATFTVLEDW